MNSLYQKGLWSSSKKSRAAKQKFFLEFTHDLFTGRARLQYDGNARRRGIRIKFKTKCSSMLSTILGFPFHSPGAVNQNMIAISTITTETPSYTYTLPLESTNAQHLKSYTPPLFTRIWCAIKCFVMMRHLSWYRPYLDKSKWTIGLEANQIYYSFNEP